MVSKGCVLIFVSVSSIIGAVSTLTLTWTSHPDSNFPYFSFLSLTLFQLAVGIYNAGLFCTDKVECVFSLIVISILPHAEFGPNGHGKDAPHFTHLYKSWYLKGLFQQWQQLKIVWFLINIEQLLKVGFVFHWNWLLAPIWFPFIPMTINMATGSYLFVALCWWCWQYFHQYYFVNRKRKTLALTSSKRQKF